MFYENEEVLLNDCQVEFEMNTDLINETVSLLYFQFLKDDLIDAKAEVMTEDRLQKETLRIGVNVSPEELSEVSEAKANLKID